MSAQNYLWMGTRTASSGPLQNTVEKKHASRLEILGEEQKQGDRKGKLVFWYEILSLGAFKIRKFTLLFCVD